MFLDKLHEYKLANAAAERFQLHAIALGAAKLEDNLALEMLNKVRCLASQIDEKFFEDRKELTVADQEMCQVILPISREEQSVV